MKVLGLTGGIGSGKTTVANFFKSLGVPVFIADEVGKDLMNHSESIKRTISKVFGPEAYAGDRLNAKFLAEKVFADKVLLEKLNQIVHPAVASGFQEWKQKQNAKYIVYETAILFEKGGYKKCDFNLLITAPLDKKIQRLQNRDKSSLEEIQARMNHQWPDKEKVKLADFVIENDDLHHTEKAVALLHQTLLNSA